MSCKFLKFYWICLLLVFCNCQSFAQKNNQALTDSVAAPAEEDSVTSDDEVADTLITKTVFDSSNDSILKWKRGREFGYMAYLDSLLRKKTDLRIDTVSINNDNVNKNRATTRSSIADNSNSFLNSFGVRIFFWIIAIIFVGFILYKLFFAGGLFAKESTKVTNDPEYKELEALNDYSEYNLLIREAELKNNFNLAMRYLYLQCLKKLADRGLIGFSPDKANNLYIQELSGHSYQQEFILLTLNYEYVWYGQFVIDTTRYQKLKEEFISFNKKV